MKPINFLRVVSDHPFVASLLLIAGMVASVEIVSALSPRWAPIIFVCVGIGGAITVLFDDGLRRKITKS